MTLLRHWPVQLFLLPSGEALSVHSRCIPKLTSCRVRVIQQTPLLASAALGGRVVAHAAKRCK